MIPAITICAFRGKQENTFVRKDLQYKMPKHKN